MVKLLDFVGSLNLSLYSLLDENPIFQYLLEGIERVVRIMVPLNRRITKRVEKIHDIALTWHIICSMRQCHSPWRQLKSSYHLLRTPIRRRLQNPLPAAHGRLVTHSYRPAELLQRMLTIAFALESSERYSVVQLRWIHLVLVAHWKRRLAIGIPFEFTSFSGRRPLASLAWASNVNIAI